MAKVLDGRVVQVEIEKKLTATCSRLAVKPHLVIIQVGQRPESTLYIARKKEFGERVGVSITHARYPQTITEAKLISEINNFNHNPAVHGIIVQIPLPKQLNTARILNAISAMKDVDGLSAVNLQLAWQNNPNGFRPATARGVLALLDYYRIPLRGRSVVIIGRSALVGKHLVLACLNAGATVTVCHRETKNLSAITKLADILIVSAGSPGLITKKYVGANQVVVDVGINVLSGQKLLEEIGKRKIVGDVAFAEVAPIVRAISPVPGGVGPLTIACLFENLMEAYHQQIKR
ncbi:MAG: bifunctional 5,10-methylenetetrahydrofolate dehydrogenase/5,10-methenyltetrahydrofolate cyclohydrolase [Candidatus Vogelbacteria bacterium]